MKQENLFGEEYQERIETKYTSKIQAPIYEPKNKKPHILELFDNTKTLRLIREIDSSNISDEDKTFLKAAAHRHTVFNYQNIADYYANSSKDVQMLMEKSALIIIDFEKAIELGFVKLNESITQHYLNEYEDAR